VFDIQLALETKCVNGQRYTPDRFLDSVFEEPVKCMSKKKEWKGASSMFVDFIEGPLVSEYEFDFLVNN